MATSASKLLTAEVLDVRRTLLSMWRIYPPTPDLVVHADWGAHSSKRWMCSARNAFSGVEVEAPTLVGDLATFWTRIRSASPEGFAVVGFDFPIGVPRAYAELAGLESFPEFLRELGTGRWSDFYALCEDRAEITLERPFYPCRPGDTKRTHLIEGLGLRRGEDLFRACERKTSSRGPASPLFWTLGPKQVGRAAIAGWRDLVAPGLRDPGFDIALWPFDGRMWDLIGPNKIVIAETYPAEACIHLGIKPPGVDWKKTTQEGRASQAPLILEWAARRRVSFSSGLEALIRDGFGSRPDAEDPLDALLGALSMIEVCFNFRSPGDPPDPWVKQVEGWILGQKGMSAGSV